MRPGRDTFQGRYKTQTAAKQAAREDARVLAAEKERAS